MHLLCLQALPKMQQLQHFKFKNVGAAAPPNLDALSSLCPNSLSHLSLSLADIGPECSAAKAWQYILPAQQQQQQRGLLEMKLYLPTTQIRSNGSSGLDFGSLASCCPYLQSLSVTCTGWLEPPILAIHQLTRLTHLSIAARHMGPKNATVQIHEVAQLTQLQHLSLTVSRVGCLQALRPLTALQKLQELKVVGFEAVSVPGCESFKCNMHLTVSQRAFLVDITGLFVLCRNKRSL